ncbi:hypothetical protein [Aquabacterium sp.]|uniref:hypothetical protein n=1 Tax=Aquabacterium sp. TaxID=1872578 RepID=UPI0025BE6565|nr:hypothetical protein [Aquabacterium sp.]
MVMLVDYLDAIARRKKRDVLYVDFGLALGSCPDRSAWKMLPARTQLIEWFCEQEIELEIAVFVANDEILITPPYRGEFYIDIPYDKDDPKCQLVLQHMETNDGFSKLHGVRLCLLELSVAEKYAYRDLPGFLESLL